METNTASLLTCSLLVLTCFTVLLNAEQLSGDAGGWSLNSDFRINDEGHCNIDVFERSSLSYQQFIERYAFSRPVVLRGLTDNTKFRSLCSKSSLLEEYGDRKVRLSTANTYSYRKVDVPFEEYVQMLLRPQSADALGSDTLYFFGDNNFTEWRRLFEHYESPPYVLPHTSGAYSFGIAGSGTGVPFHWHGPGYSEVIYGRKVTTTKWRQNHFVLADGHLPKSAGGRGSAGVHHPTRRAAVFSGPLVARDPQPGHQCFYLHLPGLRLKYGSS